jgi:hypothetical protein
MAVGTAELMKKNRMRNIAFSFLIGILAANAFPSSSQSFFDPCDGKRARSAEPEARALLAEQANLADKKSAQELFRRYWMAKSYRPYNIDKCFELAWSKVHKQSKLERNNKINLNSLGTLVDVGRSLPWKSKSSKSASNGNNVPSYTDGAVHWSNPKDDKKPSKRRISASPRKLPKRQIAQDRLAPKFSLPHSLVANGNSIQINGHASDDSRLVKLTANGREIEIDGSGNFQISVYVPISGTEVMFQAVDEWNNSALHQVIINRRQISSETSVSFSSLDPRNINVPLKPTAVALIIGIEKYENLPEAQFANRDAQVFYDYANRALGVPEDRIKLLVDAGASETKIKKALKHWLPSVVEPNESDVYVFFAGHGLASSDHSGVYLLPEDGDPDLLSDSAVSKNEMLSLISRSSPKQATIFLDTCYSGLSRTSEALIASARGISVVHKEIDTSMTNITVLSASSGSEISHSLKDAKHGLFSYFLMRGIEERADKNGNQQITSKELYDFVKSNVERGAAANGWKQTPTIDGDGSVVISTW